MIHPVILNSKQTVNVNIDLDDLPWLLQNTWSLSTNGYLLFRVNASVSLYLHRLVLKVCEVKGFDVDHINRDKLDNRKENLRLVTRQQNNYNGVQKGGSSKFKGVYRNRVNGVWVAGLTINYKNIYLHSAANEHECAFAYNVALSIISPECCHLNQHDALPLDVTSKVSEKVKDKLSGYLKV